METLEKYVLLVENVIRSFGMDPRSMRAEQPATWYLERGSVGVYVQISNNPNDQKDYLSAISKIMDIPKDNQEALYRDLLELNSMIPGAAFSIIGSEVYLSSTREMDNIQEAEIATILNCVGMYADSYDDLLKEKYGNNTPSDVPNARVDSAEEPSFEDYLQMMGSSRAYQEEANNFIETAKRGNANEIITLFNPSVIEKNGIEYTMDWINQDVIPFFKGHQRIGDRATVSNAHDHENNSGMGFYWYSVQSDNSEVPIAIYVINKEGKLCIGNVVLNQFFEKRHLKYDGE